jgi:RsiW-degrading membrane proteinase PrsW (M82 family)
MIIILAILAATRATPLGQSSPLAYGDKLQAPSYQCSDPRGCRSLFDILRSCFFTVFLCTWASVHPNIPSFDERWPRITVRRVGLMLAALIMPEVIIGLALRQRMAAGRLGKEHKGE